MQNKIKRIIIGAITFRGVRGEGIHGGGSFNITSACISLPQVSHSGVPRGSSSSLAPPGSSKNTKLKGNYV